MPNPKTLYVASSGLLLLMCISDRYCTEDHYILNLVPIDAEVTGYKIKMLKLYWRQMTTTGAKWL